MTLTVRLRFVCVSVYVCVSVQELVSLCVFKCVVCIFTRQRFQWMGHRVIVSLVFGPLGGSHRSTHIHTNTHTHTHTHIHTRTHSIRVCAGPGPDLGQRRPHSGPFHPPEPPAASVLHPHPSSLSLLHARDCFQRLDLI